MVQALRTVATCALAFGLMALVGSATRETIASSTDAMQITSFDRAGPAWWQVDVTPAVVVTPVPADSPTISDVVPVTIKGFTYLPDPVIVPAGGSVAWTNEDNAPHTATGVGDAVSELNSGAIIFGQTFTQQFNNPGTYPYYCVYHPNMLGTVVVTP